MRTYLSYLVILASILFFGCGTNNSVQFEGVDALQKVFPESNYFAPFDAHVDVARGEHASLQFVVRANSDIQNLKVNVAAPENAGSELNRY